VRQSNRDPRSLIALAITLVAAIGMVIAVPSLLPKPLRSLVGLGPHRIAAERHVRDAGSYAFLEHQPGDTSAAVGYDPCKRIHLRINPDHAPSDGVAIVRRAMRRVEQATGLRFSYDGTTGQRPHWANAYVPTLFGRPHSAPVLVSWADAAEVTQLSGAVAGVGGSVAVGNKGEYLRYITGGVTLDADAFAVLDRTARGRAAEQAIVLHEFGHLVGLAHVQDKGELMYPEEIGLLDFGPGDLAGLARVGATDCA
jgi:hypothetical protein